MVSVEQDLQQLPILAVDDEPANVLLLQRILERAGYRSLTTTTDATEVPRLVEERRPRLLLLDLHMPRVDGFELMERLRQTPGAGESLAVLVLTADITDDAKLRALTLGARDFLTKPIDQVELVLRVRNVLQVQLLQERLLSHNAELEDQVAARTWELDLARLEVLDRLALAAEYRDDDTQEHAWRIGRSSSLIAARLGLPRRQVELIARAAPLHDIGKVGIPDAILLKPGRLTAEEFDCIKRHTTIGAGILAGSSSALLQMAELIALSHHERWDGSGYPGAPAREKIPLPARIVAVADVFDALTHERPYKRAWKLDEAIAEIDSGAGSHFDPAAVAAFMCLDHASLLLRIRPERLTPVPPAPRKLAVPAAERQVA